MTDVNTRDPSRPSSAHQRQADDLKMISTLLAGTRAMRDAGPEYLPSHPNEGKTAYSARLGKAVLLNVIEDSIENAVSRIFDEPVRVAETAPLPVQEWQYDIDLEGTSLHDFGRKLATWALADGVAHVLVDYPAWPADDDGNPLALTLAAERQMNLRPYLIAVRHSDLIAAYTRRVGGETICYHARIRESAIELDPTTFEEIEVERVRVLTVGSYELWQKITETDAQGKATTRWAVVSGGFLRKNATELWDRVPLFSFYAGKKTGDFEVKPPFLDLAHMNVRHWQSTADQNNILDTSRFPMLAVAGFEGPMQVPGGGDDDDERPLQQAFTVGPHTVLHTGDPSGKWYYVEHSGKSIDAGATDLRALEERMRVAGIEPLMTSSPGTQTATETSIDESKARAPLEVWARSLAHMLEQALEAAIQWIGLTDAIDVEINTEVGMAIADAAEVQALLQMRMTGEISRWTLYQELIRRGVLGPNFDPKLEAMRMLLENPDDTGDGSDLETQEDAPDDVRGEVDDMADPEGATLQ